MLIGVVSDTHGLLRPEVISALHDVAHIVHAGDVGDERVLSALREIAPVTAVRGNVDRTGGLADLPFTEAVELAGKLFYVVHRLQDLDLDPVAAGLSAVITGHTHKPEVRWDAGILYLNPGSIGPRRFALPVTLVRLNISDAGLAADLIPLV